MLFLELIESFLGPLNTEFGKLIVSVGFVSFFSIALSLIGISKLLVFLSILVSLMMFISFGWIPLWIVIAIAILLFALGYVNVRGASNG
jgi:hypothetical protein